MGPVEAGRPLFLPATESVESAGKTAPERWQKWRYFGDAVAIHGNTAVISAPSKDPNLGNGRITGAGGAYVFVQMGGEWKQEAALVGDDASVFDRFGWSVDIDGNTVVVGANEKTSWFFQGGCCLCFYSE